MLGWWYCWGRKKKKCERTIEELTIFIPKRESQIKTCFE